MNEDILNRESSGEQLPEKKGSSGDKSHLNGKDQDDQNSHIPPLLRKIPNPKISKNKTK